MPLSFEFSFYSLMVYSTNPRTSPHTSTKRREGINPKENALKPQLISITITYNTSSLARPIKLRLTAPNWERPSPDYGSHIIMSITGIYLRISIPHTISFTSPIFNSGARDNIVHNSHNILFLVVYMYICSLRQSGT